MCESSLIILVAQVARTSHHVETRFDCPQTFLSVDFYCGNDISD